MAQNVYDSPSFFAEYNKLPRSQQGFTGAPEWPLFRSMIGDVSNASILDLGCGYGWFCRWAIENGASSAHGVDISQNMLNKAQSDWPSNPSISYQQGDLDDIELPQETYTIVYSSLAFHYLRDIKSLFRKVQHSLKPGGRLAFSIEHPHFTAPLKPKKEKDADGQMSWLLNSYHYEGDRWRNWLGETVRKQHRTVTSYIEALLETGFRLTGFKEWRPSEEELREHPDWIEEMHRSTFLLMSAVKI